jgi:hypothetical protein
VKVSYTYGIMGSATVTKERTEYEIKNRKFSIDKEC